MRACSGVSGFAGCVFFSVMISVMRIVYLHNCGCLKCRLFQTGKKAALNKQLLLDKAFAQLVSSSVNLRI